MKKELVKEAKKNEKRMRPTLKRKICKNIQLSS